MFESHEHITCREVVETVTEYFDGGLGNEEAELFEQHLNFCEGCGSYLDQMRSTVAAMGRIEETKLPPATYQRLRVAFRDRRRS